jgi:iron-sulfur cluster repair protein YtfE (RIC family)
MDVLHFLKSHHDTIREGFDRLAHAEGVKARRSALDDLARDIQVHVALEKDYLYPEISGLFAGADVLVTTGLANGTVIGKRLKVLTKLAGKTASEQGEFPKRQAELKDAVIKHFEQEEQTLMPKMRSLIRTEEREDLGQVFMDVKAEVLASLTTDPVPPPAAPQGKTLRSGSPARGRKRA